LEGGTAVVCVATEAFAPLAEAESRAWGWDVPLALIQHPLGGIPASDIGSRATQVIDLIASRLLHDPIPAADDAPPIFEEQVVTAPADAWDFNTFIDARGWGDGFPVLAPTPDRVARMLAAADVSGSSEVGRIPPERLTVTAQEVAVNAVLAGCPDAAFGVVLAAVRASLDEKLNLLGLLATTHPCTIATIVSGPVAAELGMNTAASLYGPGNRMNALIGRSVRLALKNLGRAWPGPIDKSTQGSPAKYSFCFAENLEESPWGAYHTDRGFDPEASTVTVVGAEGSHNIHDPGSTTAENLMTFIAGSMTHSGHNNLYHKGDLFLVLCPEHAGVFDTAGWSRDRIREELFSRSVLPATAMGPESFAHYLSRWPDRPDLDYETAQLSIVHKVEDINILVAGGPGKHSSWIPTFGQTYSSIVDL
jgi:hypothetical protein